MKWSRCIKNLVGVLVLFTLVQQSTQAQSCLTKERVALFPEYKSFDTSGTRGLADNYFLWDPGETIYVKFMNGSPALQNQIWNYAKEWEKFANVHFERTNGDANVRVFLEDKGGHYSMLGNYCNSIPQSDYTLHLDTLELLTYNALYRTTMHEFGHVLGLLHEHFSPKAGIQWNLDTLYADYKKYGGWEKEEVDAQVLVVYDESYTNGTEYDPKSIMHYTVMARHTKNGYSVGNNATLSDGDKALIGKLYPFTGSRPSEVMRIQVRDYTGTVIERDNVKKGLNVYPSFTLNTAGVQGTVHFIALFYDKDGKPIPATDSKYSVSGVTATYQSLLLPPNKNLAANKGEKDFPLFLPESNIPVAANTSEIFVRFCAWVSGKDEIKPVFSGKPVSYKLR